MNLPLCSALRWSGGWRTWLTATLFCAMMAVKSWAVWIPAHWDPAWVDTSHWDPRWVPGHWDQRWVNGYYGFEWADGYWEDHWVSGYWDNRWVSGYWQNDWVAGYWQNDWVPGYWDSKWKEGRWEDEWVSGHWNDVWNDGYWNSYWVWDASTETGYYEWEWIDGYWSSQWVDGYWDSHWVDGNWESYWVDGHWDTSWVDGYWNSHWVDGYWEPVWIDGHWESSWVEGHWYYTWHDGRYEDVWIDGYWEPQGTWVVSGYWNPNGTFVPGHWDPPLELTWRTFDDVVGAWYPAGLWSPAQDRMPHGVEFTQNGTEARDHRTGERNDAGEERNVSGYQETRASSRIVVGTGHLPVITSGSSAGGSVGVAFGYQISANYATSYSASGLPPGLSANSSGQIAGTPTQAGSYSAIINASNIVGTTSASLSISIGGGAAAPVVAGGQSAGGTVGNGFSYSIAASNSPTSYSASNLPPGVSVNTGSGVLSGTPTTAGTYSAAVSATNAGGTGAGTVTITISPPAVTPPVVAGGQTAGGTVNAGFSYGVAASNSPTSYTATGLPAGLTINASNGVISGTPTVTGTFTITVSASNSGGTSTPATMTVTINAVVASLLSGAPAGAVGSSFSYAILHDLPSDLRKNYQYTASGLPPGLRLNPVSGEITGTPTQAGSYSVAMTATNSSGSVAGTKVFTIVSSMPATSVATDFQSVAAGGEHFVGRIVTTTTANGNLTWLGEAPRYAAFLYTAAGLVSSNPTGSYVEALIVPTKPGVYRYRMDYGNGTNPAVSTYVGQLTVTQFPVTTPSTLALPGGTDPATLRLDPIHWAISNSAATFSDGTSFDLNPRALWNAGNAGSPEVTVLVMDTGVQADNPTLHNVIRENFSADKPSNPNGLPYPQYLYNSSQAGYFDGPMAPSEEDHVKMMIESHGTQVAGAVAGLYLNSANAALDKTAVGMAPGVRIAAAKVSTGIPENGGLNLEIVSLINALNWGVQRGARISVSSFRTFFASGSLDAAFEDTRGGELYKALYASPYAEAAATAGMLHFVASANDYASSLGNAYPASLPSVVAIGAVTKQGNRALFSNYGPGLGFAVPGQSVVTSMPTWFPRKPGASEKNLGFTETVDQGWGFLPTIDGGGSNHRAFHATYAARAIASGPIVFGGLGLAGDTNWAGRIVLLDRGTNLFVEKVHNVENSGGLGCIIVNHSPPTPEQEHFYISLVETTGPYRPSIPVFTMDLADGTVLKNQVTAQSGLMATMSRNFGWSSMFTNSGTSFAAPYAAGIAALVLSQNPDWTTTQVEARLQGTAKRRTAWGPGYDPQYGFGVPSAYDATQPGQLSIVNLSTRAQVVSGGEGALQMGFVIRGSQTKRVLIRAVGPKLASFGLVGTLINPKLEVFRLDESGNTLLASNTSWTTASNATQIAAATTAAYTFPLNATGGDSAVLVDLSAGSYSAVITSATGDSGLALAEIYDASGSDPLDAQLVNLSTRAYVGVGEQVMIGGFVIEGNSPRSVLIRGVGPSLPNVAGALSNPRVTLQKWNEITHVWQPVAENDDWGSQNPRVIKTFGAAVGAFDLLEGSKDAAIHIGLSRGMYSVMVSGVDGASGIALVEVYPAVD